MTIRPHAPVLPTPHQLPFSLSPSHLFACSGHRLLDLLCCLDMTLAAWARCYTPHTHTHDELCQGRRKEGMCSLAWLCPSPSTAWPRAPGRTQARRLAVPNSALHGPGREGARGGAYLNKARLLASALLQDLGAPPLQVLLLVGVDLHRGWVSGPWKPSRLGAGGHGQ